MVSTHEHTCCASRQTLLDAQSPGKPNWHVLRPTLRIVEAHVHTRSRRVGTRHDDAVTRERATPELHGGVLLSLGKAGQPFRVGCRRDGAALRQIWSLAEPADERQAIALDELEQLRYRVRPVAGVQQCIGQSVSVCGIPRSAQQRRQRVLLGQRLQDSHQIGHLSF